MWFKDIQKQVVLKRDPPSGNTDNNWTFLAEVKHSTVIYTIFFIEIFH